MNPPLQLIQGRIVPRRQLPLLAILASVALLCFPPVIIEDWNNSDRSHHVIGTTQKFIPVWQWSQRAGDRTVRADWPRLLILLALANLGTAALTRTGPAVLRFAQSGNAAALYVLAVCCGCGYLWGVFEEWGRSRAPVKPAAAPAQAAYEPNPPPQTPPPLKEITFAKSATPAPFDPDAFLRKLETQKKTAQ